MVCKNKNFKVKIEFKILSRYLDEEAEIDLEELYKNLQNLRDFDEFAKHIAKYLEKK